MHTQLTQDVSELRYIKWKSVVVCVLVQKWAYDSIRQVLPNFDACRADCREVEDTLREDATEVIAETEAEKAEMKNEMKKAAKRRRKQHDFDRKHLRRLRKKAYDAKMRDKAASEGKRKTGRK